MKRYIFWAMTLLLFFGCSRTELPQLPPEPAISGLATPVKLQPGETLIYLADYVTDPGRIENVSLQDYPDSLYLWQDDKLKVISSAAMKPLIAMEITVDEQTLSVPLFRSDKQRVVFEFDPAGKEYKAVSVRGEFNGWTAGRPAFEFDGDLWKGEMMLAPGSYQYLLVTDGNDRLDPACPDSIDNNAGGFNSLINVGGGLQSMLPRAFTLEFEEDRVTVGFRGEVTGGYAAWQNTRLPEEYIQWYDDKLIIHIPGNAHHMKRSYIRAWVYNSHGISNDILIPLESGRVLNDAGLLDRSDHHSMILYNAFVDRFHDADPGNNRPLNIPEVLPPADYHGGDIKGVTARIADGYFRQLGVNTIWISPVVKNPEGAYGYWPDPPSKFSGYHGYWPVSFTLIDDRYGTEQDLLELVEVAHRHNMNVLLDIVANHVHEEHPVYKAHPDWATELYLPDGSLNTERWDEYRLTTWFDVFLPTLDLERPEVYEMLSDSALYWIKKYGLDGFRHDATKHIPEVFWRTLTRKLKEQIIMEEGRKIYQIGETYGGPELIGSYVGSGMLDAQFDFNVYDDALAVLINPDQPFSRLQESLQESLKYYGAHNLMGYISGNQDRGRFTSYAGGSLRFDEDAKLAGWTRDIGVGDPSGYDVTALLFAFNMTIPGLPVIYYGDEIGMPGGNDPDSRRMMRFDDLSEKEAELRDIVARLAGIRSDNLAMTYGDFENLHLSQDTWAYARTYFGEMLIVVLNKSAERKNVTFVLPDRFMECVPESFFGSEPVVREGKISINLEARSFDVLSCKNSRQP